MQSVLPLGALHFLGLPSIVLWLSVSRLLTFYYTSSTFFWYTLHNIFPLWIDHYLSHHMILLFLCWHFSWLSGFTCHWPWGLGIWSSEHYWFCPSEAFSNLQELVLRVWILISFFHPQWKLYWRFLPLSCLSCWPLSSFSNPRTLVCTWVWILNPSSLPLFGWVYPYICRPIPLVLWPSSIDCFRLWGPVLSGCTICIWVFLWGQYLVCMPIGDSPPTAFLANYFQGFSGLGWDLKMFPSVLILKELQCLRGLI